MKTTARTERRLNLPALRGFFMGVVGWPPQTVLHDATLRDLCEAYSARRGDSPHGTDDAGLPPSDFMRRMLAQYPDRPVAVPAEEDKNP